MREDYSKGDIVKGHFCFDCLPFVNPCERSLENPAKNALCLKCGHYRYGLNSTGQVGDWLIIGKSKEYLPEPTSTPPAPDPRDALIEQMGGTIGFLWENYQNGSRMTLEGRIEMQHALAAWQKFKEEGT